MVERDEPPHSGAALGPTHRSVTFVPDDPAHLPARTSARPLSEVGELSMRSARAGTLHTISLAGELDLANANDVDAELVRVEATDATMILLDLTQLTFMDSTGVRRLLSADARSRADGHRFRLRRPPDRVQRVPQRRAPAAAERTARG